MGIISPLKPLQVNPIKHSNPMGAALAFMGIKNALPLMHGAQGCASFTKVFLTRHFAEPIAIQNTAVSDITAVLDGGDYSITAAIEHVMERYSPELIGLHTTGLTETKGDDVARIAQMSEAPIVYVNTPDYEGGMEEGWARCVLALITQLTKPAAECDIKRLVILPHLTLQPLEVERLKLLCAAFGFNALALPDLSTSLDGHLEAGQGKLTEGGICTAQIQSLASASIVLSVGASMEQAAKTLCDLNPEMSHLYLPHLMGLDTNDTLIAFLMQKSGVEPSPIIKQWRKRLQDALLDCHFVLGKSRLIITGEPDQIVGMCALLRTAGATIEAAISTVPSPSLERIDAKRVFVGDLEDAENLIDACDLVIGNTHCERLADEAFVAVMLRGFPNYEEVGNALKSDVLYEGSCAFLFEVTNTLIHHMRKMKGARHE